MASLQEEHEVRRLAIEHAFAHLPHPGPPPTAEGGKEEEEEEEEENFTKKNYSLENVETEIGSDGEMRLTFGNASFLHEDKASSDGFLLEFSDGTTIPVHTAILSMSSPVFKAMLFSSVAGENTGSYQESTCKRIRMQEGSPTVQKQFVKWMYALPDASHMPTKTLLDSAPLEDIVEVFVLAHYYQCNAILCMCARYMVCRLNQYAAYTKDGDDRHFRKDSSEGVLWLPDEKRLPEAVLEWVTLILIQLAPYCSDADHEVASILRPVLECTVKCEGIQILTWIDNGQLCKHIKGLRAHAFAMILANAPRKKEREIEFVKFLIKWIAQHDEHHTSGEENASPVVVARAPLQLHDFRALLQAIQWERVSMHQVCTMHENYFSKEFQDLPIEFREEFILALLEVQIRRNQTGALRFHRYGNNTKSLDDGKKKLSMSFKRKKRMMD